MATRDFMEPRFGYDLSRVRLHIGTRAAESAQAVHAIAYKVGPNIVFGKGNYAPKTDSDKKLLAHELTRVIQQAQAPRLRIASIIPSARQHALAEDRAALMDTPSAAIVQRKPEDAAKQCGGTWACAVSPCDKPDPGREGDGGTPRHGH
ncbi:MAG TPA: DUF4157 domain-containing protein [Candidatus Angelobacter sp.]|jgi:hypothetical protein|nr:DUF4157 domain-containing protein [Candidatus Angelobacter sp.]